MYSGRSLVDSATTKLKQQTRTFDKGHSNALEFVNKCNEKLSQRNLDETQTLVINGLETTLSVKRQRKKKRMTYKFIDRNNSNPNNFNILLGLVI